jgi:type IV pilus assembly protein PilV
VIMNRQKGFTLVEVLVSIVVLAVGLLGLAGLQLISLKAADSAYHRSQASILVDDIVDRMRANRANAVAGSYNIDIGDASPTGTSIAEVDLANWRAQVSGSLTSGDGAVAVNAATHITTITIQWDDSRAGGDTDQQFVVNTEL